MSNVSVGLPPDLHAYLVSHGVREPDILKRLRDETAALPQHDMQIAPEQGAFMAMLVGLIDARRAIELGTFTGYSSLAVALAMPSDGRIVCCDVSEEWTSIARRYWAEAGVADRVDLRLGPALETLDALIAGVPRARSTSPSSTPRSASTPTTTSGSCGSSARAASLSTTTCSGTAA